MNMISSPPIQSVKSDSTLRPLPLHRAVLYFLIAGLGLRLSIYTVLPWLIENGLTNFEAFTVTFTVPVAILFALAFAFAKWEGTPETLPAMINRLRLQRPTWRGFFWVLAGFGIAAVGSFILTPTRTLIMELSPILQPPANFPALINPLLQNEELPASLAAWLGANAIGNWDIVILTLIFFFFNIFGEELFFRGIIFPRQELVHGRHTWIIHGLLWNLFHLPIYPWYLLFGLPITLTISFVAQKTGNTWMTILLHTLANLTLILMVIGIVVGAM